MELNVLGHDDTTSQSKGPLLSSSGSVAMYYIT